MEYGFFSQFCALFIWRELKERRKHTKQIRVMMERQEKFYGQDQEVNFQNQEVDL